MIIVEQNFGFVMLFVDDVVVVSKGQIVWMGDVEVIKVDEDVQYIWLGV